MSSLLVLYPDIPQSATRFTSGYTFSGTENQQEDFPAINTFRGARGQLYRSNSDATNHYITYDLGPSVTKSANFLVVSRLDILVSLGTTVVLTIGAGTDDTAANTIVTHANVDALSLVGPYSNDFVETFADSTAYRYWLFNTGAAGAFANTVGKVYFGSSFNPAVELDDYEITRTYDSIAPFSTAGGSHLLGRSNLPRYVITTYWDGLTNGEVAAFMDYIYKNRFTTTFFLYTQTYHDPLNAHRLLHVMLESAESKKKYEKDGYNYLTARWVEVLS